MNDFIELRTILTALRRRWWLLLALPLLLGSIAYGVSRLQQPIYRATASLAIDQAIEANALKFSEIEAITQLIRTNADLAIRQPILERVVQTLALPQSWQQLQTRVRATPIENSQVLEISAEAATGEEAAIIANHVAQQLVLFNVANSEQRNRETQSALAQVRLTELEKQMQDGQQQLDMLKDLQAKTTAGNAETALWQLWLNPTGGVNPLDPSGERTRQLNEEIGRLERLMIDWEKNYDRWKLTLQENRSFKSLTIVEPAQASSTPIWPRPFINLLLASGMGLVLALGIISLLEHFDNTLKLSETLAPLVQAPVLGAIRRLKNGSNPKLLLYQDDPSPIVEDYRVLHSKMQLMCTKLPKTILITSPNHGEGRSLTTANLGIVAAQFGYRTIVVDADWERASQHQLFQIPSNKGLQQLLFAPSEPTIPLWTIDRLPNLTVLTSGQSSGYGESSGGSATEWWRAKRLGQVLAQLTAHADLILIDGPALLTSADATLLAGQVDGVILLVEANHTKQTALQESCFALERAQANLLGIVWNQAESQISNALVRRLPEAPPAATAPRHLLTVTAAPLTTSNLANGALTPQAVSMETAIPTPPAPEMGKQEVPRQETTTERRSRVVLPLRNGKNRTEGHKSLGANGVHPATPMPVKILTFEEVGLAPLTLQGKQNRVNVPLALGDALLMAGDQVQLALVIWLADVTQAATNGAGHHTFLDVALNGAAIGAIPLEQSGAQSATLTIPALPPMPTDSAYLLQLTLRSNDLHALAPEMTVVVRSTSRLLLNARQPLLAVGG
ncbi:MAG: hypothetical protein DYG89_26840 [Caldilinea sp. CFX5]|nr:hypothetical protein [Caldilinea sp. CFX5]